MSSSRGNKEGSRTETDWVEVLDGIGRGDPVAFAKLARMVTGFLSSWRAFDFRDDWDDMVQDVVIAVVEAHQAGRLQSTGAIPGYVRQTARFKFVDRIRARQREAPDREPEEETAAGGDASWPPAVDRGQRQETRVAVWDALERLSERERAAVVEVYANGRTYEEAAEASGIPLGSLKRFLRTGLESLRRELEHA